jgi:hypothetical protein
MATNNPGPGIEVVGDDNHVWGNTVHLPGPGGTGIRVTNADRSRIALNTTVGCFGIVVHGYSTYTVVWSNDVSGCPVQGHGEGISLQADGQAGGNARVRLNTVSGIGFGIVVRDQNALIAGNDASGNGGTGIDVAGVPDAPASNVVRDNNADNNGQYGIFAADGSVNAAASTGNTASGNGVQDCVNVTCTP